MPLSTSARSPDQNLPVVIVGKGPSARYLPPGAGAYRVAALNGAVRLCTWADWLFVNDLAAFAEISPDDLLRHTGRVVLPAELHIDLGKSRVSHRAALPFLRGRPFDNFELHTNPNRSPELPYFGHIASVAESAVAWLLHLGYRRFHTLGIDPEGGYAHFFREGQQVERPPSAYRRNWLRLCRRVRRQGGAISRLAPDQFPESLPSALHQMEIAEPVAQPTYQP